MRERAGSDLAEAVEFGDALDSNHNLILLTHILNSRFKKTATKLVPSSLRTSLINFPETCSMFRYNRVYANILKNVGMFVVFH
jgi:hypothetical protein